MWGAQTPFSFFSRYTKIIGTAFSRGPQLRKPPRGAGKIIFFQCKITEKLKLVEETGGRKNDYLALLRTPPWGAGKIIFFQCKITEKFIFIRAAGERKNNYCPILVIFSLSAKRSLRIFNKRRETRILRKSCVNSFVHVRSSNAIQLFCILCSFGRFFWSTKVSRQNNWVRGTRWSSFRAHFRIEKSHLGRLFNALQLPENVSHQQRRFRVRFIKFPFFSVFFIFFFGFFNFFFYNFFIFLFFFYFHRLMVG